MFKKSIVMLCILALGAFAQSDRGTITGSVNDTGGAVVPKAEIVAVNPATGVQLRTETTETGDYTIPSVPAGTYDISAQFKGFRKYVQTGVIVGVAQTARVDINLQVGEVSESITVSSDAALLQTESATQGQNITTQRLNELPIQFTSSNGGAIRNPLAFASIAPGTTVGGWNDIKVNGSPGTSFRIIFEGQDTTSALEAKVSDESQPSIDAIEEFTLQTSNFSAEFGQVAGGLYNFTAKSGTNGFHGTAYGYNVNEAYAAGNPFSHLRPRNRQNDFGGAVGGPVWIPKVYNGHNKTFFYANWEDYRKRDTGLGGLGTIPTNAYRNGDFSYLLTGRNLGTDPLGRPIMEGTIYDPATERVVNGRTVRDPFQGNIIPTSRFDPVAANIQKLIPSPTGAFANAAVSNFALVYKSRKLQSIPSIKIDHNINDRNRITGYWSMQATDKDNGLDGLPDPISARRDQIIRSQTVRLSYDFTITPTLINHMGIGYQRYRNPDSTPTTNFDAAAQLGFKGGIVGGFPRIDGLNINGQTLGFGPTNYGLYVQDKPTAVESLTWVHGAHTFKFGGEWRIDTFSNISKNGGTGDLSFDASQTGLPSTQGQDLQGGFLGNSYASFLLGRVNSAWIANPSAPQYRRTSVGTFAQDTWKVSRKLTLDIGIRWDLQQPQHELYYRTTETSLTTPNPSAGGLPGAAIFAGSGPGRCNCDLVNAYKLAFGPRIGMAYQIDPKTVFRAGWGVTYGQLTGFNYMGSGNSLGFGFNSQNFSNPAYGQPAFQMANGIPVNVNALYAVNLSPGLKPEPGTLNQPPALIDPNGGRPPRISQWSIGLQREVVKDLLVEAAYVGNRAVWVRANGLVDYNAMSPERLQSFGLNIANAADRDLLTSAISSPQVVARGFKLPYASFPQSATLAQALRPFPQFNGVDRMWTPVGNVWYDSLQVKVTKRYSKGLSLTGAYTWSKNLTTAGDEWEGNAPVNNVFAPHEQQKSLSWWDQPQILSISYVYELPAPRIARNSAFSRIALQGWKLGGLLRYASGTPLGSPGSNNNLYSLLYQGTRQNRVPGQPLYLKDLNSHSIDPNKDFVLNPAAWQDAAPGQWGTAAANYSDFRGPRYPSEQMSIGKQMKFSERMSLDLRFEVFNPFNRLMLNAPDSGNPQSAQVRDANGVPTAGFGRVSPSLAQDPRSGQLVARFYF